MHISAKVDYAVRALLVLAAADPSGPPVSGAAIARAQAVPGTFLEQILLDLRNAGLVESRRGNGGGYRLGRPAALISVADVVRVVDGPLAEVRGLRPERAAYVGAAHDLQDVWIAVRASLRAVLEPVTLADIVAGTLPEATIALAADPAAWASH